MASQQFKKHNPYAASGVDIELDGYTGDTPVDQQILVNGTTSFEIEIQEDLPKAKWYHASFHTVCAVVGAGVLGLPYSFSYLGWGPGTLMLTVLCAISLYTSYLLANMHEQRNNRRCNTYREIAEAIWGKTWPTAAIQAVQYTLMAGLCITYTVTAGQSLKGVVSSTCHGPDCEEGLGPWIVLFGATQLALSQVPDFHSLWWVSLLGGLMSIGYCSIAFGASAAAAISNTAPPPFTREGESSADHAFGVLNALGSLAFTFGGQAVLPEIQATLARPPSTALSMMKGVYVSYIIVVIAYYGVAFAGYSAFGATVSSDVLLSISKPSLLIDAANLMVVLHVAAGYQVFAMPIFHTCEEAIRHRMSFPIRPLALRLVFRSGFVLMTTFTAFMLPFFHQLMGLIASIGLIPITFIFPPLLWLSQRKREGWEFILNVGIVIFTGVIGLLAFIGSVRNIVKDAWSYEAFD